MNRLVSKRTLAVRRKSKIRTTIASNSTRPRLSVVTSNTHISAQIIDDSKGATLAYATTMGKKLSGTMTEKAELVGKEIAAKASKARVTKVVFDRGALKYHGRVKALADAARQAGMEF